MLQDVLLAMWFLLPAALANAVPVVVAKMPILDRWDAPIDNGIVWRGHRLLGDHKTWRGIVAGITIATLALWLQQSLCISYDWAMWLSGPIDYTVLPILILGPLFALGALGGDAVESFFKRARGIQSGRSWFPFDQLDYVVGAIIVTLPFVILQPIMYLWMLAVWFIVHIVVSYIGFLIGLKKAPI